MLTEYLSGKIADPMNFGWLVLVGAIIWFIAWLLGGDDE